jgi:integrase/recombinase XerD
MKRKGTKKQNVVLREKQLADGTLSLYLDIYRSGKRTYEFLKLYVNPKARTPIERQANKETYQLADDIRLKRESEMNHGEFGFVAPHRKKIDFLLWADDYIETYSKQDKRNMQGALNNFKRYIENKGIKQSKGLEPKKITPDLITGFAEYLESISKGEGAHSYFARFKKMLRQATKENLFIKSPADDIFISVSRGLSKDVLTVDEIRLLAGTDCPNDAVKRGFLFSCLTGLRFVDVNRITFANVDFTNKFIKVSQAKVKGEAKQVTINLNKSALKLIGEPGKPDEKIFNLPSHTGCLKGLNVWCKRAGINKHITWHCARHSFAVNLLSTDRVNIKTVQGLLGHSSLAHTTIYTRVIDQKKLEAVNLIEL